MKNETKEPPTLIGRGLLLFNWLYNYILLSCILENQLDLLKGEIDNVHTYECEEKHSLHSSSDINDDDAKSIIY